MAGIVTVQVDTSKYGAALMRFREYSKLSFRNDIRQESRLLGQMLIKLTPPKSQAQGRSAVKRDINYIADGISDDFWHNVAGRQGTSNVQFTNYSKDRSASMFIDWQEMTEDMSRLKQYHRSQRTRRGRVNKGSRISVSATRWTVKNALVVPKSLKKRYVDYEMGFVGAAKGGWAVGTLAMGGKAPAWVSRHATSQFGAVTDSLNTERPGVTFHNRSPWAGSGDEAQRITQTAVNIRAQNLDKRFAKAQQLAAKQAGFVIRQLVNAVDAAADIVAA